VAAQLPDIVDVHEIKVGRSGEHIHVTCHCTLPTAFRCSVCMGRLPALEDRFKLECPEVYRVTIHSRADDDNLR